MKWFMLKVAYQDRRPLISHIEVTLSIETHRTQRVPRGQHLTSQLVLNCKHLIRCNQKCIVISARGNEKAQADRNKEAMLDCPDRPKPEAVSLVGVGHEAILEVHDPRVVVTILRRRPVPAA